MTNRAYWLATGGSFAALWLWLGAAAAVAAGIAGVMTAFVISCTVTDSQRAERAFLITVLVVWFIGAFVALTSGPTPCGPDDVAGCFIRR